jgi:peptidoglycan/LPS O-acetylase OafA/YrhL
MTSKLPNSSYIPEFDGLRGFAVTVVMLLHANISFFKGGFIGVDMFFVLSGFLITSLLVREYYRQQHINLKHFYLRRIMRLGPALLVFLAIFACLSFFILDHEKSQSNLIDIFIAIFYFTNWAWVFHIHINPPHFLAHTWSLAIEEQFYILWPIMLITLLKSTRSRISIAIIVTVLTLASWSLRTYLAVLGSSIDRLYSGFDTRAGALFIGCLLGFVTSSDLIDKYHPSRLGKILKFTSPLCLIGLLFFCIVVRSYENIYMYYWGFSVVEILTAIILMDILILQKSLIKLIFSRKLLIWIGKISYGLYLWHYPIFITMRVIGFRGLRLLVIGYCISFLVASASYYFFERPILDLKNRSLPNVFHKNLYAEDAPLSSATIPQV